VEGAPDGAVDHRYLRKVSRIRPPPGRPHPPRPFGGTVVIGRVVVGLVVVGVVEMVGRRVGFGVAVPAFGTLLHPQHPGFSGTRWADRFPG
jgi:hypothetical protein